MFLFVILVVVGVCNLLKKSLRLGIICTSQRRLEQCDQRATVTTFSNLRVVQEV